MYIDEKQLREFIKDSGVVSRADFDAAEQDADAKKQGVGSVLVRKGKVSEDDLRKMQAYLLGIPFVDLKQQRIDFETLSLIPEPIARSHNIVSFKKNTDSLEVAMLDTDDLGAIDFIKKKTHFKILPRLTDAASIKSALLQYQKSLKAEFGDLIKEETDALKQIPEGGAEEAVSATDLKKRAEDLPIVRIVDALLKHAVIQNASDIHIEPMEGEVLVRYRIDGILQPAASFPIAEYPTLAADIRLAAGLKSGERSGTIDGRFSITLEKPIKGKTDVVDVRLSIILGGFGETMVMRLLNQSVVKLDLDLLHIRKRNLDDIIAAISKPHGIILNTGPTGSGKTTTLYSILSRLNTPEVKIITVEDPIEYQIPGILQTQVSESEEYTFATALRSLLRQNPDILMIGEIRDNETADIAVQSANTGHLVLSTLHANSAAGVVSRLTAMGVSPDDLANAANLFMAQRLVRKICAECKESRTPTEAEKKIIEAALQTLPDKAALTKKTRVAEGKGCTACSGTGFAGQMVISETLLITKEMSELISRGALVSEIESKAAELGMMTLAQDGILSVLEGDTTLAEVKRVTDL